MRNLVGKIVFGLSLVLFCGCGQATDNNNVGCYFAAVADLEDWTAADTARTFEGQDLFLLINGGAELYHKNGFVRVGAQTFQNRAGCQISVELHEMNSADGARTIYQSKISPGGESLSLGDGAMLNSYYLNAHRGRFQLTLVGYDSEMETIDGLKKIAEAVLSNIE